MSDKFHAIERSTRGLSTRVDVKSHEKRMPSRRASARKQMWKSGHRSWFSSHRKLKNEGCSQTKNFWVDHHLGKHPRDDLIIREIVIASDTILIELTTCWVTSEGRWVNDRPTNHVVSDKLIVATLLNTRTNPVCNVLIRFAKILSKWSSTHRPTEGQMLTTHYHRCLHRIPTRWASN